MTGQAPKRLGEILAAKGFVSEDRIVQLLARAAGSGKRIGDLLIAEGLITEDILNSALEEQREDRERR